MRGVIVAGGNALRMGGLEKPLVLLRGRPLIDHVIERVRPQVETIALNAKDEASTLYRDTAARDFPVLADRFGGEAGPVGGVLAGLDWAASCGAEWLATFPADTPFLPLDLVERLVAQAGSGAPVVAVTSEKVQGLCAIWPVSCRVVLEDGVRASRYRSLWWTLDDLGAERCPFEDSSAFFNVNTEEDLANAERLAKAAENPV